MAKSTGLFKRKSESRPAPAKKGEAQASKASKDKPGERGALSDAFDEIEAEETKAEPPRKLFRATDRLEDELIQFLDMGSSAGGEAEPPESLELPEIAPKVEEKPEPHVSAPAPSPVKVIRKPVVQKEAPPSSTAQITPTELELLEKLEQQTASPQPSAIDPPLSFPEDLIYEMIRTDESKAFARKPAQTALRQQEKPRAVHQRVLKAPPPKPEHVAQRTITIEPPSAERAIQVPIRAPPEAKAEYRSVAGAPILTEIRHDYMTLTLLMRWVEFLLERVTREKMSLVMDYYYSIGWIGEKARSEAMACARGEMQDVTKFVANEDEISDESPEFKVGPAAVYKKVDDWRLSADDHLKSLLFITKMAGMEVDRDKLNSLEQSIKRFKENLDGYFAV